MALLSSLYPRIIPYLPQASQLLVEQKIQDTVVDFFARTKVHQVTLDPIDTVIDQAAYPLVIPVGYQFVQVMNLEVKGQVVEEKSEDTLDLNWTELGRGYTYRLYHNHEFGGLDQKNWRYATASVPRYYYIDSNGFVRLVAIPDTVYTGADGIVAKVALKPLFTATEIPDGILNDHYQALVDGALMRMMRVPNKPWSDKKAALEHEQMYEQAVSDAEAEMLRSNIRNDRVIRRTTAYA